MLHNHNYCGHCQHGEISRILGHITTTAQCDVSTSNKLVILPNVHIKLLAVNQIFCYFHTLHLFVTVQIEEFHFLRILNYRDILRYSENVLKYLDTFLRYLLRFSREFPKRYLGQIMG